MSRCCPRCSSTDTKKNGHIHLGKQNHYCKECSRQFVENPAQILISDAKKERIQKLLLERIPHSIELSGKVTETHHWSGSEG